MPKNSAATWLLFSIVSLWVGLAAAEPPRVESTPPATVTAPTAEGQEGKALSEDRSELRGVVIEEIPKGSTLEKAGLLVGDVITAWKRLPNPPANSEAAGGSLTSYFDWLDLVVEQAPRGTVVLGGRRGEEHLVLTVCPGLWGATVRPVLTPALEKIYVAGKAHFATGDLEVAVQDWRLLADAASSESSGQLRGWIYLRLGETWGKKGEWEKAIEAYRETLDATESPQAKVAAWEALGKAQERRNKYEAAENAYTTALEFRHSHMPGSLAASNTLTNLGSVAWARQDLVSARSYFLEALQNSEKLAPESLAVATCLTNLGAVAGLRGELDTAYEYDRRAQQLFEKLAPRSLALAQSESNLGAVAHDRGELDRALGFFSQALQIQEQLSPMSLDVAASLNNLGAVALDRGELDRAHDFHSQALEIRERLFPQSFVVAGSLNDLGVVARVRGELDRAHDYYLRALRISVQLAPDSLRVAATLANLGSIALAHGELDHARDYYGKALKIEAHLAPNSLKMATSLNNLGNVALKRGEVERARDYYLQALNLSEKLAPQSLQVATNLNNLGEIAQTRGEFDRAKEYHLGALGIKEQRAPRSFSLAVSLNNLGDVAVAQGESDHAHDYYGRALDVLEYQVSKLGGSYNAQAGFRSQHRHYYQDMLAILFIQSRFAEAFQILERFRAQTFLTMLAERDTAFTADIPEELDLERRRLGSQYDRTLRKLAGLNPRDNSELIETTRQELQKLDDEAGDIEARIRSASPKLAALRYPQPLDAAAAQQALDPGTLLLSFSVGKGKTALFALSRSGDLEVKTLPLGEKALRTRVKQLLGLLQDAKQGSSVGEIRQRRIEAVSRELYTALLGPLSKRVAASERLLILPDGPLHVLPFAALVHDTKDGPQYLAAWKPLHVALSATVYAELKQRRHPAGDPNSLQAPLQLAAFGDPVYPQIKALKDSSTDALPAHGAIGTGRGDPTVRGVAERGLFDFQPLPYTRREVLGIASLFPAGTARTYLGSEALEERVKSLDPKTRILHLAAHGGVDEHLPSGSFIALTIPEETTSDDTGPQRDNGLLQMWEIFERVRLNADLVVLSACDTGLGEELGGEGLIGLTRAFQYAGARSVLASLWNVQDQATSELMIRFYKHLLAGLTKDQALQAAQQEFIRGPIEVTNDQGERVLKDFRSPYYWAGFQLYGDWQ